MSFIGKTALITGASRGIGRAIALELAKQGADIGINYVSNQEQAQSLSQEIQALGRKSILLPASVAQEEEVKRMFNSFVEAFGKLDILVCNAGIVRDNLILRMKAEDFMEVIRVNLIGTFLCMKEAGSLMLRNRYGRVVAVSSITGTLGNIGQANYAASKSGMIGLVKTFAQEFAKRDITANVVVPGLIETDMTNKLTAETKEKFLSCIPKKRMGTPEEVAKMVAFLCSEEAAYITGDTFSIAGGM
ncbi:MAG: 3-oxoacyl-[acyl-carrier-protein] reductase [Candidatus Brocadiae bacterium]|nr:3-oxoacyl-[acyl-carrier-protein] reductase [Candidatus Brocadiia bacterium]